MRPNKGMKLTRPERIGASQLIPGVLRTCDGAFADSVATTNGGVGWRI